MNQKPKIATVVGARPQFVKTSLLSKALEGAGVHEVLIHTGQHYDDTMSAIFFREMAIPKPQYNLGIGGLSQGAQTGKMLEALETVLLAEKPQALMVYGDTNSTLAGALAGAKLQIPIVHIEAGLRCYNRDTPEEINRVLTDHLSEVLFCPSAIAKDQLKKEGIEKGVHVVGDIMVDCLRTFLPLAQKRNILKELNLKPGGYFLATIHRAANTNNIENLKEILKAFNHLGAPVVFPVHPRTRPLVEKIIQDQTEDENLKILDPVGYLDFLALEESAQLIITDSGGIQKEAYALKVPCLTLRQETEWTETLQSGWNRLIAADCQAILKAVKEVDPRGKPARPYGQGQATQKMLAILLEHFSSK